MTVLLYRDCLLDDDEGEFEAAQKVWGEGLYRFRSQIPEDETVIARYSVWPFYGEVEEELSLKGCELIHSLDVYNRIREMDWYHHLSDLTPRTWFDEGYATVPECEHGWICKGRTHSRKWRWDEMMRAETREELESVLNRLNMDGQIRDQGTVIREYVPLKKIGEGINGLPLADEWRCFFWGSELLSAGFYWAIAEDAQQTGGLPGGAREVAEEAAELFEDACFETPFVVIDVARTEEGDWIVIELNDGQMSGLSTIDPESFYRTLRDNF